MTRTSSRRVSVYRSKVDAWYIGICALVFVMMTVALVVASKSLDGDKAVVGSVIAIGVIALVAWVTLSTSYTLDDHELIVRSGPITTRIDVRTISSIGPATGAGRLRSSPALSLDRLLIVHGAGKSVMISPADSQRFLTDLASRK